MTINRVLDWIIDTDLAHQIILMTITAWALALGLVGLAFVIGVLIVVGRWLYDCTGSAGVSIALLIALLAPGYYFGFGCLHAAQAQLIGIARRIGERPLARFSNLALLSAWIVAPAALSLASPVSDTGVLLILFAVITPGGLAWWMATMAGEES